MKRAESVLKEDLDLDKVTINKIEPDEEEEVYGYDIRYTNEERGELKEGWDNNIEFSGE